MALFVFKIVIYIAGMYVLLATGCEYRSYRGGHRYIRAFRARTFYQRLFTLLQCEKDIHRSDMGKLTYPGYAGVALATASGAPVLAISVYLSVKGRLDMAETVIGVWAWAGMGWGIVSAILTGVDSLANRFL